MKQLMVALVFALCLWGSVGLCCIDPPTKFRLAGSSFASIPMTVSAYQVSIGDLHKGYSIRYRSMDKQWCVVGDGKDKCGLVSHLLKNDAGAIVGVFYLDHTKKTVTLKQCSKPYDRTTFRVDDQLTKVVFEDQSDMADELSGSDRLYTAAIKADGSKLGQVTSSRFRAARGVSPSASEKVIDLALAANSVSGCGGR